MNEEEKRELAEAIARHLASGEFGVVQGVFDHNPPVSGLTLQAEILAQLEEIDETTKAVMAEVLSDNLSGLVEDASLDDINGVIKEFRKARWSKMCWRDRLLHPWRRLGF